MLGTPLPTARLLLIIVVALPSFAVAATRVGLCPLDRDGPADPTADEIQGDLRRSLAAFPDATVVDLPASPDCKARDALAAATLARASLVDAVVQGSVERFNDGYALRLKASVGAAAPKDVKRLIQGGSADLQSAMDLSACELLATERCIGTLKIDGPKGAPVTVDARVVGALPFNGPVAVGRHSVRVGKAAATSDERFVSVAFKGQAALAVAPRGAKLAFVDVKPAAPVVVAPAPVVVVPPPAAVAAAKPPAAAPSEDLAFIIPDLADVTPAPPAAPVAVAPPPAVVAPAPVITAPIVAIVPPPAEPVAPPVAPVMVARPPPPVVPPPAPVAVASPPPPTVTPSLPSASTDLPLGDPPIIDAAPAKPAVALQPAPPSRIAWARPALIASSIASGAFVLTGVIFGAVSNSKANQANAKFAAHTLTSADKSLYDSARSSATVANVSFGLAALGAVTAGAVFLIDPSVLLGETRVAASPAGVSATRSF